MCSPLLCSSGFLIALVKVIRNNQLGELKDSLLLCEYKSPTPYWPEMEEDLYRAATDLDDMTTEDLYHAVERGQLLERAIFMRNHARTRDMEVEEIYPYLTYPNPFGEVMTWSEWSNAVDLYYAVEGWDRKTGWPLRAVWEAHGLADVADEPEQLERLPAENESAGYIRKSNPFSR